MDRFLKIYKIIISICDLILIINCFFFNYKLTLSIRRCFCVLQLTCSTKRLKQMLWKHRWQPKLELRLRTLYLNHDNFLQNTQFNSHEHYIIFSYFLFYFVLFWWCCTSKDDNLLWLHPIKVMTMVTIRAKYFQSPDYDCIYLL